MADARLMANYYMQGGDGKEYGPVSVDQLRQWTAEGRANAQTKVRTADGTYLMPMGSVPELAIFANPRPATTAYSAAPAAPAYSAPTVAPAPAPTAASSGERTEQFRRLAAVIAAGSTWMKLMALIMFLLTFGMCITIVGIIFAWLPLWQGINLWSASERAKQAVYTGSEQDLAVALDKIRKSFSLGVWTIAAMTMLYFILSLIAGLANLSHLGGGGLGGM